MDFKKEIAKPEYDFLRNDPDLGKNICLLTLGGSYAYGTNVEDSDLDIRGICLNRPQDLIGISTGFQQYNDEQTDTVIYSMNKIFELLCKCNPNTIEILGNQPDKYFKLNDIGKLIIDNRELFLSKKAYYSFCRFAEDQLHRMKNALANNEEIDSEQKTQYLSDSLNMSLLGFNQKYADMTDYGKMFVFPGKSPKNSKDTEILLTANFEGYPLADLACEVREMCTIINQYDSLNRRNKKKTIGKLNKHVEHLFRLFFEGLDILVEHEIITYREKEHDFLMELRNGKLQKPNGDFTPELDEFLTELRVRLNSAYKTSTLPDEPDKVALNKLLMKINKMTLERRL
jgi:predicted nucleotidyltransferase